jgi:nitroreductase/FMN reductase [NAD(P)H]
MASGRDLYRDRFGIEPKALAEGELPQPVAAILQRRSQRAFLSEKLAPDLLEALLACAQSAPSKSDLQQYSIILVDDPESRATVLGRAPADEWMRTAPHVAVFCADMRRGQRVCALRGRPHRNDNLDAFLNASADAALAMGFLMAAAEAAGVGCCPISLIRDRIDDVTRVLGLPDGIYPVAGFCFGKPARPGFISMRLPPAVVVHRERYDVAALEREISQYDRRRNEKQPIAPQKQRLTQQYGVADYYPWSENAARQLSAPERPEFSSFLRKHGFALS